MGKWCPVCDHEYSHVLDARRTSFGRYKRRRQCLKCSANYTTYEITAEQYDKLAKRTVAARKRLLTMIRRVERELADQIGPIKQDRNPRR